MAAGAAAYAATINALKAFGVVVRVEPGEFAAVVGRAVEDPLVVVAYGGTFKKSYKYLTSYKGLAFFAQSPEPIVLPRHTELIQAKSIAVPAV